MERLEKKVKGNKLRKNILIGTLALASLFGFLFVAKASEYFGKEEIKYENIDLSLKDEGTGNLRFDTLEKVLEYTNSEEQQKDSNIEIVNVYPNPDGWDIAGGSGRTLIYLYGNQEWQGINPAVNQQPLDASLNLKERTLDSSIMKTGMKLYNGAKIRNLFLRGYFGAVIAEGNTEIKNCYFKTYGGSIGVADHLIGESLIIGNTFEGRGTSVAISVGLNASQLKIRNNTFNNYSYGIQTYDVANLNLGTETDRGNNSFVSNMKNLVVYKTPTTIPAQYNLWANTKDIDNPDSYQARILTNEQDILDTIQVMYYPLTINKNSTKIEDIVTTNTTITNSTNATDIEVVPFLTRLPYALITKAKPTWRMYE
jgi:hypothetical protein